MRAKWSGFGGFGEVFRNCTIFEQKMLSKAAEWATLTRQGHGRLLPAGVKSSKTSNENG
jgi:hypothetical protein